MKKTVSGNVKNEMIVPQYRVILHRGSGFTSLNLVKKLLPNCRAFFFDLANRFRKLSLFIG
jgi:hypothetical protein